jgi:hypothetical protein
MQKLVKMLPIMLLTAGAASLAAAPVGFSINADSPTDDADGLYRIDLATGAERRRHPHLFPAQSGQRNGRRGQ